MIHTRRTTVTCPDTGRVYPLPAGGAGDEPPAPPAPADDPPAPPAAGDPPTDPEPTPPWGSPEEFNPDKAWKLIQNLRGDLDELKPKAAKLKEIEDAQRTDLERAQEALETERTQHETTRVQLARLQAAVNHGLSAEDVELLGSGTAEEIEERAKRLADRLGTTPPVPGSRRQGGGGTAPTVDVDKLIAEIPRL